MAMFSGLFIDGKQHKTRKVDMITLRESLAIMHPAVIHNMLAVTLSVLTAG